MRKKQIEMFLDTINNLVTPGAFIWLMDNRVAHVHEVKGTEALARVRSVDGTWSVSLQWENVRYRDVVGSCHPDNIVRFLRELEEMRSVERPYTAAGTPVAQGYEQQPF